MICIKICSKQFTLQPSVSSLHRIPQSSENTLSTEWSTVFVIMRLFVEGLFRRKQKSREKGKRIKTNAKKINRKAPEKKTHYWIGIWNKETEQTYYHRLLYAITWCLHVSHLMCLLHPPAKYKFHHALLFVHCSEPHFSRNRILLGTFDDTKRHYDHRYDKNIEKSLTFGGGINASREWKVSQKSD